MEGAKIHSLNTAIREAIPHMREVAIGNPNATVFVRAISFASGAQWHVVTPTPVASFEWSDLAAGGLTSMGRALSMVATELKIERMPARGVPPVLVLVSDGAPTDDFSAGLKLLLDEPWGKKAVRVAIAIGDDADLSVLKKFIAHPELEPLVAHSSADLSSFIKWASTSILKAASAPASQGDGKAPSNVVLPPVPAPDPTSATDGW
jgi:uncharacterized protein YegL